MRTTFARNSSSEARPAGRGGTRTRQCPYKYRTKSIGTGLNRQNKYPIGAGPSYDQCAHRPANSTIANKGKAIPPGTNRPDELRFTVI